jgi:hypothetical protein
MGHLMELVFECSAAAQAGALLDELVGTSGGVRAIEMDGEGASPDITANKLVSSTRSCATIRLSGLEIPLVGMIPDVALRLLMHGGERVDVEVNFDIDDVSQVSDLVPGLHNLARRLGARHVVVDYYAGLEPAVDDDTRIFSGESLGPLRFSHAGNR